MAATLLSYKKLYGADLGPYLRDLARLRMEIFREFPYLYEGSLAYEQDYLQTYLKCSEALIALAFYGDLLVGATTCLPFESETSEVRAPFERAGIDLKRAVYFGESILKSDFRGRGVGNAFFDMREAHAKDLFPNLSMTGFCAVCRPEIHPRKPASYRPLDEFWVKRGYSKQEHLVAAFSWKDIDDPKETLKPLVFWTKNWG